MPELEIACFNAASALIAQASGADRIELCSGYEVGGTTPSHESLQTVKAQVQIPVYVMIRPRGGNFVYSKAEFEQMEASIAEYKLYANGFVFGILDSKSQVDTERNKVLIDLAHPKPCTFHRAFDSLENLNRGLEDVIQCGFSTILTSGGASNASTGIHVIANIIGQAKGRIAIMPGGSVRSVNIEDLQQAARAPFFHSSAILGSSQQADAAEISSLKAKL